MAPRLSYSTSTAHRQIVLSLLSLRHECWLKAEPQLVILRSVNESNTDEGKFPVHSLRLLLLFALGARGKQNARNGRSL